MDLAYLFQDLRSEALKAISWPSRCGNIVRPASGDAQTVNCAETRRERQQTVEVCRWEGEGRVGAGLLFTWCADSIVVGGMVRTNGPHEAEQAAAKHGGQEGVKCSVEEQDEAWRAGEEQQSHQHQEQRVSENLQQSGGGSCSLVLGL